MNRKGKKKQRRYIARSALKEKIPERFLENKRGEICRYESLFQIEKKQHRNNH